MTLEEIANMISERLGDDDSGVGKKVKMDFGDDGCVLIDMTSAPHGVSTDDGDAECTISASAETFQELFEGELDPTAAFMTGKIKIDGDMGQAMKLSQLLA